MDRDRNLDLVEYISLDNTDMLGCQRKLTEPSKQDVQREPPKYGDEYTKCAYTEN